VLSETCATIDIGRYAAASIATAVSEATSLIDTETEDDSLTEVGMTNEPDPHELDTTSSKVLKVCVGTSPSVSGSLSR
jgi:hypothetical protein